MTNCLARLGQSGLKISKVVLGAMSLGSSDHLKWAIPEDQALPVLKHAFDRGINTWDTVIFPAYISRMHAVL